MGTNYQPLQLPAMANPVSTGLDRMRQAARDEREKQRQLADMILRRQQFAEQQRQAGFNEQMQRGEAERSQGYLDLQRQAADRLKTADERTESERVIKVRQQAEDAAAQGNYDLARQLMQSIGATYNAPKRYTIGGDFQISGKRPQQPAGGPEMSVLPQDTAAIQQGTQNVGAFLNGQAPLNSRFEAAMPRVLEQLNRPAPEPQRTVSIADQAPGSGPMQFRRGDESITIDPDAVRARQAAVRQAEADRLAGGFAPEEGADPEVARLYDRARRAVAAGLVDPKTAYTELNDQLQALENNRRAVEVARMRAKRGSGGAGGGLGFKTYGQWRQDYKTWQDGIGFDDTAKQFKKFNQLASSAARGSDPELTGKGRNVMQRNTLYQMARLITGPGVLTKEEYANTVQNTLGMLQGFISRLEKDATGSLSDDEWREVQGAVDQFRSIVQDEGRYIIDSYDAEFGDKASFLHRKGAGDEIARRRGAIARQFGLAPSNPLLDAIDNRANQNAANAERIQNGGKTYDDDDKDFIAGGGP